MDKQRFCCIVAKAPAFDRPKRGTGYFVRANLVLTAAHVVEGAESIEVSPAWSGATTHPADLLWCRGAPNVDVALLRVSGAALQGPHSSSLATRRHTSGVGWQSHGYADAAKSNDRLLWMSGEASAPAAEDTWFALTVKAPPEEPQEWQGVSGAPVFVGAEIVGVISKGLGGFSGERMRASAVHRAMADAEFLSFLSGNPDPRRHGLRQEIENQLRRFQVAANELCEHQSGENEGVWREAYRRGGYQALSEAIVERSPLLEVLRALDRAHENLVEQGRYEAAGALETILLYIVPLLQQPGEVRTLVEGEAEVVALPVYTKTVTEMTLAAIDCRPLRLMPPEKDDDFPASELSLSEPAPDQIDELGFGAFGAFVHGAARNLLSAEDRRFLADPARPPARRHEAAVNRLRTFFDRKANDSKAPRRYYVHLLELSIENGAELVAKLRREFPQLRLVRTTGDEIEREGDLCEPLVRLLFRAHGLKGKNR